MKQIKCELCGGSELIKQDGVYVCQHCGTKYSSDEAKKLMVDVTGPIKIDDSNKLQNLIELEKRYIDNKQYEEASDYCSKILELDPHNWQILFDKGMSSLLKTELSQTSFSKNKSYFTDALNELEKTDIPEKKQAITDLANKILGVCSTVSCQLMLTTLRSKMDMCRSGYADIDSIRQNMTDSSPEQILLPIDIFCYDIREKYIEDPDNKEKIDCITSILHNAKKIMEKDILANAIPACHTELQIYKDYYAILIKLDPNTKEVNITSLDDLKCKMEQDRMQQSTSSQTKQSSSGCYIATSVYGSYDCPEVWTLRRFRDHVLASTWLGRLFIKTYYSISPKLVKNFGQKSWFKSFWKKTLNCFVSDLNAKGIKSTPYNDKNWL